MKNKKKKIKLKNKIEAKHIYYFVMIILYLYLISKSLYQLIWGKGLDYCKSELLLIIVLSVIFYFTRSLRLDSFTKAKRKTESKKDSVRKTNINNIKDSLFISLMITTFYYLLIAYNDVFVDFYNMIPNNLILSVIGFAVIIFLVSFIIVYLLLRFIIRKN